MDKYGDRYYQSVGEIARQAERDKRNKRMYRWAHKGWRVLECVLVLGLLCTLVLFMW